MTENKMYPFRVGQYECKEDAESFASKLETQVGDIVEITPVLLWEVIVTGRRRE